jgi:hypothetical protein
LILWQIGPPNHGSTPLQITSNIFLQVPNIHMIVCLKIIGASLQSLSCEDFIFCANLICHWTWCMIPYISCHYVSPRNSRDKFLPDISLQRPRQHWKIVIGIWKVHSVNPAAILISKGMSTYECWGAYGFWTPELQKISNKMLKPSFYDVATYVNKTWVQGLKHL